MTFSFHLAARGAGQCTAAPAASAESVRMDSYALNCLPVFILRAEVARNFLFPLPQDLLLVGFFSFCSFIEILAFLILTTLLSVHGFLHSFVKTVVKACVLGVCVCVCECDGEQVGGWGE